jgi:hypothetical protein
MLVVPARYLSWRILIIPKVTGGSLTVDDGRIVVELAMMTEDFVVELLGALTKVDGARALLTGSRGMEPTGMLDVPADEATLL